MYKKSPIYIPLEPLVESADTSWDEIAQRRLFESELTGKGCQQPPKSELKAENEPVIDTKKTKVPEITKESIFKNVGFVNRKRTEIMVEDEEECKQLEREEVKRPSFSYHRESCTTQ